MSRKIEILDLLKPDLPENLKRGLAWADANPVALTEAAILSAAEARTGLFDFGPDDFRARLGLLVEEWERDVQMTQLSRRVLFDLMSRYATNRLLIQDYLKQNPDVNDEVIDRPVIVVGLPRSGTTNMLNLLAADSRLRSLPSYEAQEPLPNPKEPIGADGTDPRRVRAAEAYEAMMRSSPLTAAMHDVGPDDYEEDLFLMCPNFGTYNWEWMSHVPRWRDFHISTDQTPHYEYQRTVLKILQHRTGPTRWVNKCPQHLEQLHVLRKVYPDATIVITHRDPVDAIQSAATMMSYADRTRYPKIDGQFVFNYWTDRVEQLLRACVRDHHLWPESQRVDVPFEAFQRDPMRFVHEAQTKAGLPVSAKSDAEIKHYVDAHPRGKNGQLVYNIERDFGMTRENLRERFAFYFEAFPFVTAE
jgi:hypothetical protein